MATMIRMVPRSFIKFTTSYVAGVMVNDPKWKKQRIYEDFLKVCFEWAPLGGSPYSFK